MALFYEDDYDDDDDGYGEDSGDGYGDDDYGDEDDEDVEGGDEDGEGEDGEQGGEDEDASEKGGKNATQQQDDKKKKGLNKDKMIAKAKSLSLAPQIMPMPCPKCKQMSLFLDGYIKTGVRGVVYVCLGALGVMPWDKAIEIPRFCCLNPKCKSYYPRTGDKLRPNSATRKLMVQKNWFHISRD